MSRGRGILGFAALAAAALASLSAPAPRASGALGWAALDGAVDFAPEGMPDFDQRQPGWASPIEDESRPRTWTHDGPVAGAAALWWLDSRAEPRAFPPPAESDGFGLVTPFGFWDDHATSNVRPLVEALARASDTNGAAGLTPPYYGTCADDLEAALDAWLEAADVPGRYTVRRLQRPTTEQLAEAVRREQAVILLLGFWQPYRSGEWGRLGGHYVGLQAADDHVDRVRLSDPFGDRGATAVPPELHNRAGIVVHEDYLVAPSLRPGPVLRLLGYAGEGAEVERLVANFQNHNRGDCASSDRSWVPEAPLEAHLDVALIVAPPGSDASPTASTSPTAAATTTSTRTATAPPTAVASRRPDRETPPAPAPTRTSSPASTTAATATDAGVPGGTASATATIADPSWTPAPGAEPGPGTSTAAVPTAEPTAEPSAGPPSGTATVAAPSPAPGATSAATEPPPAATSAPTEPLPGETPAAPGTPGGPSPTPTGPASATVAPATTPAPPGAPTAGTTPPAAERTPAGDPGTPGAPATEPPAPSATTTAPPQATATPAPPITAEPSPVKPAASATPTPVTAGTATSAAQATETLHPSPTRPPDRGDARPARGERLFLPLALRSRSGR